MILQYEDGTLYCGGYKIECLEEILLDYEITQGYCCRCQRLVEQDAEYIKQQNIGE